MVILILEKVPPSLRGEVSRWLVEVRAGVFVGKLSALVRDEIWNHVAAMIGQGAALMIWSTNTEQGFSIRSIGQGSRSLEDIDGVILSKTT